MLKKSYKINLLVFSFVNGTYLLYINSENILKCFQLSNFRGEIHLQTCPETVRPMKRNCWGNRQREEGEEGNKATEQVILISKEQSRDIKAVFLHMNQRRVIFKKNCFFYIMKAVSADYCILGGQYTVLYTFFIVTHLCTI